MCCLVHAEYKVGAGILGVTTLGDGVGTISATLGYGAWTLLSTIDGAGVTTLGDDGLIMFGVASF